MKNINKKLFLCVDSLVPFYGSEINMDSKISSFDLDSLDQVELIMEIEKEFDIQIRDEDAEKLLSKEGLNIRDLKEFLREKYGIIDIKEERQKKLTNINNQL